LTNHPQTIHKIISSIDTELVTCFVVSKTNIIWRTKTEERISRTWWRVFTQSLCCFTCNFTRVLHWSDSETLEPLHLHHWVKERNCCCTEVIFIEFCWREVNFQHFLFRLNDIDNDVQILRVDNKKICSRKSTKIGRGSETRWTSIH
jgi:hypothetical protein